MTSTWGNWGNYAVYGQSYTHTNSQESASWTKKDHSLSWGSTSITSIPDTLAGSLSAFRNAIAQVRMSLDSTDSQSSLVDGFIYASQVQTMLNNAKGTVGPYYQNGTISFNVHGNHSVTGGHSNHSNTSRSNGKGSAPHLDSAHSNSDGASWTVSSEGMQDAALEITSNPIDSYATPQGIVLKSQANAILAILNGAMVTENSMPSFGTRSFGGTNTYSYSENHGNHNSHSN